MSAAAFIEKLDDRLNPIVVKELRQAFQGRWVISTLLLFLTLQVLILGIFLMTAEPVEGGMMSQTAGREVFRLLQGILLTTCMLLVPAYAGLRLAAERNDANVDLLFISTLTPRAIIWGKLCASFVLTLLIFSACAPFMTFTYLLRGVDLLTIFLVLLIDFAAVLGSTQLAIFAATIPGNRAVRGILGLGTFIGLLYVFGGTIAGTIELTRYGLPYQEQAFWWALATSLMIFFLGMILLFTASVAMVSPPSTNRALPVRIAVVITWLVTGLAAGTWCYYVKDIDPLYVWLVGAVCLFSGYLIVAINEREEWTPRVARTIPRSLILRVPAFFLFTGSAGGVLFSILGSAASFGVIFAAESNYSSWTHHGMRYSENIMLSMLSLLTYSLAYALTAALIRRHLMSRWIKQEYTWVLVLVLIAFGSTVPYLLYFLIMPRHHYMHSGFNIWLALNPFVSLFDWNNRQGYLAFASAWAAAAMVFSVAWFYGQLERFRRFEVEQDMLEEVPEAMPVGELVEAEVVEMPGAEPEST